MPANGKPNGRFELPALTPISYSLTDGTDIPPPLASPIEQKSLNFAPTKSESSSDNTAVGSNSSATSANGAYEGRGRTSAADVPPLSPASSTQRPSSIRRFLSRKSLNQNYTNGTNFNAPDENVDPAGIVRPETSMSYQERPGLIKKKSGSWFRRFGGGGDKHHETENRRASVIYEKAPEPQPAVKKGPPPPKLPELNQFKSKVQDDEGSLGGGDMFKNIK
ncbi:hypothetical protein PVAG01_09113 [Phlyctema vagabunda]|uniref:Uncharacterized protein n=1 Tax=Phlyctema vagabunda TaxID=108571 RepID=A0ABR4P6F6_9HELO